MLHKKSLGQHFLRNRDILKKIADTAMLTVGDTVLEVGPGEGTLTEFLLARADKVVAVEKDARLIPILEKRFVSEVASGKLRLVHTDVLYFDHSAYSLAPSAYKIVANLPYYITGQFLRKFLQSDTQPTMMVLLLQKEVAKRIIGTTNPASPRLRRTMKESILSLSVKCYGTPKYIGTVKAGSFTPPPKVDSAIIKISGISKEFFKHNPLFNSPPMGEKPPVGVEGVAISEERFFAIIKKGFAHPRKLLASNLNIAKEILAQCGIAENARAENVPLEQWRCLTTNQE